MYLITLVTKNSVFIFSLIWVAMFLALVTTVLVLPRSLLVMVASNKALVSLLVDAVSAAAAVTVTSSTNIDSIIVILRTVGYATNSLCWIYTSEITVLMLMYKFLMHPGM